MEECGKKRRGIIHHEYPSRTDKEAVKKWKNRNRVLKRKYGISLDEFGQRMAEQQGLCQICRREMVYGTLSKPVVDHDHVSGNIRGILCARCNMMLGHFFDSSLLLLNAARYLDAAESKVVAATQLTEDCDDESFSGGTN